MSPHEATSDGPIRACGAFSGEAGANPCPGQENGFKRRLLALVAHPHGVA